MKFTGTDPIYIQIADYIKMLIEKGVFLGGDALPSVRDFGMANGVNPNTVARAYELLIEKKVIISIPKKGYFVPREEDDDDGTSMENLEKVVDSLLLKGYSKKDILDMLEKRGK